MEKTTTPQYEEYVDGFPPEIVAKVERKREAKKGKIKQDNTKPQDTADKSDKPK